VLCRLKEHQTACDVPADAAPSRSSDASAGSQSQEQVPADSKGAKRKRVPEGAAKFLGQKLEPPIKKGQRWGTLKDGELASVPWVPTIGR
jgi:hypothetical protein